MQAGVFPKRICGWNCVNGGWEMRRHVVVVGGLVILVEVVVVIIIPFIDRVGATLDGWRRLFIVFLQLTQGIWIE